MGHPLFDLTGRVALVSGAAQGMGKAMALAFAEAGANLVIADINNAGVEATAAEIQALGQRALPVTCDITDIEQIRAMFARLDSEYGRIDVLGNVAGPASLGKPEEMPIEQFDKIVHALLVARFCCCQEAGRRMLSQGRGSIINIGSLGSVCKVRKPEFEGETLRIFSLLHEGEGVGDEGFNVFADTP